MSEQRKIRVAVVFGGRGPEHAVSCMGGGNMLASIDRVQVRRGPDRHHPRRAAGSRSPTSPPGWPSPAASCPRWRRRPSRARRWLPGRAGSWPGAGLVEASAPGQIPHAARRRRRGAAGAARAVRRGRHASRACWRWPGCPTSGPGVLSSAVSMDKEYMKLIFAAKGLPVGPYVVLRERDWPADEQLDAADLAEHPVHPERKRVLDEIADLGWPLFVKPARGGSSIGTSKAHDLAQLREPRSRWPGSTTRRCWSRRPWTAARSRSRCWRAWTARRRTPACPASC